MIKDELLKYAKEKYPVGTKYKCPANIGGGTHGLGINIVELGDEIKFRKDDEIDIIGKGYIYYEGKWAEILEKPKFEPEFEVGKWYELKYLFNKKPCNILVKSTSDSINNLEFDKYYDLNDKKWVIAKSFSIDHQIKIIYIKELSLQEIQQYLPDGHPDKFITSVAKEFVLPKHWFLRFKTKEVFDELCAKYSPEFEFYENAGICNDISKTKLGNYYYLSRGSSFGEEITFDQFKKYVLKYGVKEEVKPNITWKVGDYVVFVEDWFNSKKGDIDKIKELGSDVTILYLKKELLVASPLHKDCKLKVFSTLQEAQKFSDELLGKSKTGLRVEDLVEGEIYVNGPDNGTTWCYIIKYSKNSFKKAVRLYKTRIYSAEYCNYMEDYTEGWLLRLATPDEKKWLKTCIKQDKFIEQSELNKYDDEGNLMEKNEEYPEYVECIYSTDSRFTVNKIYKVKSRKESCLVILSNNGKNENTGGYPLNGILWKFKPSTKEAYEAQFKKDDKFKNGDWLVYIEYCGHNPSTPIKIGDVRQMIEGRFGSLVIYGVKDLSQYFRRALPHEIPVNNSIKEEPKLVFPYKVGDKIRCIKLNTWADTFSVRHPTVICEGKVVEITKVGDFDEKYECIPFAATYNGVEYGFSYSDDNKYELVDSFEDFVSAKQMEFLHQMNSYPVNPEECYLNKQEVKNPLDDSEREVNINFSKPKQIKFL